jgi:hypothetical protein
MTTTLTQVDPPPPSPTLGGVAVVLVAPFLRAAIEAAAEVERTAAAAGVDLTRLGRHIGVDLYARPLFAFGFTACGRHWHAVRGWTRDGLGYPVEPADACTECDARARAHPPAGVPAQGRSPLYGCVALAGCVAAGQARGDTTAPPACATP